MTEAAEERPGRRQRSLHCKPAEQAMIRERAEAASKTVSRYVMELALADDPDRHPLVLSEEEQAELRDGVLDVVKRGKLSRLQNSDRFGAAQEHLN